MVLWPFLSCGFSIKYIHSFIHTLAISWYLFAVNERQKLQSFSFFFSLSSSSRLHLARSTSSCYIHASLNQLQTMRHPDRPPQYIGPEGWLARIKRRFQHKPTQSQTSYITPATASWQVTLNICHFHVAIRCTHGIVNKTGSTLHDTTLPEEDRATATRNLGRK